MKRRNAIANLAGTCAACAAVLSATVCPVRAQIAPVKPPADAAQIEAKKEVTAYKAAFAKMEKEKGWAAASRFFLTPNFKQIDLKGVTRTKDEYIRRWSDTYARINKERAALHSTAEPTETQAMQRTFSETVEAAAKENAVVVTTHVLVPEMRGERAFSLYGNRETMGAPQTQTLNTLRKVFRRTPNGLRLERETVSTSRLGIFDRTFAFDARSENREP